MPGTPPYKQEGPLVTTLPDSITYTANAKGVLPLNRVQIYPQNSPAVPVLLFFFPILALFGLERTHDHSKRNAPPLVPGGKKKIFFSSK